MFESKLTGHCDVVENSNKVAWMNALSSYLNEHSSELRVTPWNNAPYLYANNFFGDSNGQYIRIAGPLYSLIKEAAIKANTSLVIQWLQSRTEILITYATFLPHVHLHPWVHSNDVVQEMLNTPSLYNST